MLNKLDLMAQNCMEQMDILSISFLEILPIIALIFMEEVQKIDADLHLKLWMHLLKCLDPKESRLDSPQQV